MITFKRPQVAEKYVSPLDADVFISTKGYRGKLSEISPGAAKKMAERNSAYIQPKPVEKTKVSQNKEQA